MKKIIFFLQSEGRGHLTQALALKKILENTEYQLVGCVLGTTQGKKIPAYFRNKIECPVWEIESPQFVKNKNKSISLTKTFIQNIKKVNIFSKSLQEIEIIISKENPDLIINFYEVLTGMWNLFYNKNRVPVVSVGHQFLLEHSKFNFPDQNKWQQFLLKLINKFTSFKSIEKWCLSFYEVEAEGDLKIIPPLIREEVLHQVTAKDNFILVYLCNEGYLDEIKQMSQMSDQNFKVFMNIDHMELFSKNLTIYPLSDTQFLTEMSKCRGIMMTAGFESVCEAKYLKKPALLIPIENHYEQKCNAFDAELSQAGKYSPNFNLDSLLKYIESYEIMNDQFNTWVSITKDKVIFRLNLILS